MPGTFAVESGGRAREGGGGLAALFFLVAGLGFAALWSASSAYAPVIGKDPLHFVGRQALFLLVSAAAFAVGALVDLGRVRRLIGPITIGGLLLLAIPLVPGLGESRNGASRWIDLGFTTLQPSEFWKPLSVFYLAHVLDRRRERLGRDPDAVVGPFILAFVGVLLIVLQNDFSTAGIAAALCLLVVFLSGASLLFFAGAFSILLPLGAFVVLTSDFRLRRILAFLYPGFDPHGQSYQILGSLKAIKAGGFFGKGLGLGTLKAGSIPEVQSDFIFAAYAEESGFFGVLVFFALWGALAFIVARRALAEGPGFRSLLGLGLLGLLLLETLINVGVASSAVPATGIALPFFSAGGSSLIASALVAGLLVNLQRPGGTADAARAERPAEARDASTNLPFEGGIDG